MEKVKINTDYITLAQLLKIVNFVGSGGEAKIACQELEIYVNGEPENRRGKKLYPNDVIDVEGNIFEIE